MKFIVPSQLLYKNLQIVSGIITTNNAIPIIESVLFQIENKKLKLTATDLETTITTEVDLSDADGDGQIVVPAKIVLETLKSLPDVPVIFTVSDDFAIEIAADESNYKLVGYDGEEFPLKPQLENVSSFEIDAKILGNAISKTVFATGTTDIRPILAGICCEIKPEDMTFVATDSHKLVCYKFADLNTNLEASFVIPKKPLLLLKNVLQSFEGNVRVDFDASKVGFTLETLSVVSKLIEGRYPNYNAVIPKSNNNLLKVERLPLLQRMRSISPYANQSTHQVRLGIEATSMRLTAEDLDASYRATATVPCAFEYEGEETPFEIGFSSKFLQEMLNNLESDEVIFKLSDPGGAGLIFPYQEEEKKETILMLLMPVKLNT
ncbi:MAG: DNA polymerase III subunit beta [Bacteroidales bacterium]|jgi:DNA polymerase-3 subunit beta|nr:DNA polymerase III subunit beta [Bacteroidales bacterium]